MPHNYSANIYSRYRVDFTSNAVKTEAPDFILLGVLVVNALDELRSFSTPTTIFKRPTDESNWSAPGHVFGEVTEVGMSWTRSEQNYSYKNDFETRRENQDFGPQNISMSRPPLDSTHFGTNTTNRKTSPIDLIPARTKPPDPMPLTRPTDSPTQPMESSKQKVKSHVPADP